MESRITSPLLSQVTPRRVFCRHRSPKVRYCSSFSTRSFAWVQSLPGAGKVLPSFILIGAMRCGTTSLCELCIAVNPSMSSIPAPLGELLICPRCISPTRPDYLGWQIGMIHPGICFRLLISVTRPVGDACPASGSSGPCSALRPSTRFPPRVLPITFIALLRSQTTARPK